MDWLGRWAEDDGEDGEEEDEEEGGGVRGLGGRGVGAGQLGALGVALLFDPPVGGGPFLRLAGPGGAARGGGRLGGGAHAVLGDGAWDGGMEVGRGEKRDVNHRNALPREVRSDI